MTMLLALVALVVGQTVVPRPSEPLPAGDALALFRRLCVETAADRTRFAAALAREPDRFRKEHILPGPQAGPDGSYVSDRAEVNFAGAPDEPTPAWPATLPVRACGVLGQDPKPVDHPALVAVMADALGVPPGPTIEARPRGDRAATTEWTVARGTEVIKYSLVTRSSPDGRTYLAFGTRAFKSDR